MSKLHEIAKVMAEERKRWPEVIVPKEFDVVHFNLTGRTSFHVGVVLDQKNFIHITAGIDVSVSRFKDPQWTKRISGYSRHADNN